MSSVAAQAPDEPRRIYSTHDQTTTTVAVRPEVWADVKSTGLSAPGAGGTYAVGTIEVERTDSAARFSGQIIDAPPSPAIAFNGTTLKQVVVLQSTAPDGLIAWQKFFYGFNFNLEGPMTVATNARAVAVWPAESEADERIVICGETYDRELPASQRSTPLPYAPSHPTGYIAVYDGGGTLLWTWHVHGDLTSADCAITDVSIRRELRSSQMVDVVTYCGISSHGVPSTATPLSPVQAFDPLAASSCASPSSGSTDNGTGQWDGIVGRVFNGGGATTVDFHSIVGGVEQDGLFGLAELDAQRFAVIGSTTKSGTAATSPTFPLTGTCLDSATDYCVSALLVFDATGGTSGNLLLESSLQIGTVGSALETIARDVAVSPDGGGSGSAFIHVVGATTDTSLQTQLGAANGYQNTHAGGSDGFLVSCWDLAPSSLLVTASTFHGTEDDEGLHGVSVWNEFPDHLALWGARDLGVGNSDVIAASVFADTATTFTPPLVKVRSSETGGSGADLPTVMGAVHAMTVGLGWDERGMGSPAGGGVTLDSLGRANGVGATASTDYPVSAPPFVTGRSYMSSTDGIRTVFDMLPLGVSRTDGTGTYSGGGPSTQPATYDGSTTPTCARNPFGLQIGIAAPAIKRMLLDYEGPAPAPSVTPSILIDRPHPDSFFFGTSHWVGAVMDVGLPLSAPVMINQMETWVNAGTAVSFFLPWSPTAPSGMGSMRWTLNALPGPNLTFTLQVVCLLNTPFSCGSSSLVSVASPALTIDY